MLLTRLETGRLASAWQDTPTKWYPLPLGAGALLLLGMQARKKYTSASSPKEDSALIHTDEAGRDVARLKGPWQVHVLGALPLRNLSRVWGYLNGLELPVWFRPFGFKLYSAIFGCNLSEMKDEDLTHYKSLGEFFYREIKDDIRPVADTALVSYLMDLSFTSY
jgi:phosphatidylserine decarboxylase